MEEILIFFVDWGSLSFNIFYMNTLTALKTSEL